MPVARSEITAAIVGRGSSSSAHRVGQRIRRRSSRSATASTRSPPGPHRSPHSASRRARRPHRTVAPTLVVDRRPRPRLRDPRDGGPSFGGHTRRAMRGRIGGVGSPVVSTSHAQAIRHGSRTARSPPGRRTARRCPARSNPSNRRRAAPRPTPCRRSRSRCRRRSRPPLARSRRARPAPPQDAHDGAGRRAARSPSLDLLTFQCVGRREVVRVQIVSDDLRGPPRRAPGNARSPRGTSAASPSCRRSPMW